LATRVSDQKLVARQTLLQHARTPAAAKGAKLASFAADTAFKSGKSERSIERCSSAKALAADLDRVAGTFPDTGAEPDALAKISSADRSRKVAGCGGRRKPTISVKYLRENRLSRVIS
jgi:hypothetical protein